MVDFEDTKDIDDSTGIGMNDSSYHKVMKGLVIAAFVAAAGFSYTCGMICNQPDQCQDTMVVANPNFATDYKCPPGSKGEVMTSPPGLMCRCINCPGAEKPPQPTR